MRVVIILFVLVVISACESTTQKKECGFEQMMQGISCVEPNLEEISRHPLGSRENPIRADGPRGQHEYLSKLICSDGRPVWGYDRAGSAGPGPYGFILDLYIVTCDTQEGLIKYKIFMDYYHKGYSEAKVASGFSSFAK